MRRSLQVAAAIAVVGAGITAFVLLGSRGADVLACGATEDPDDAATWCRAATSPDEVRCSQPMRGGGQIDGSCRAGKPVGRWTSVDGTREEQWSGAFVDGLRDGPWSVHKHVSGGRPEAEDNRLDGVATYDRGRWVKTTYAVDKATETVTARGDTVACGALAQTVTSEAGARVVRVSDGALAYARPVAGDPREATWTVEAGGATTVFDVHAMAGAQRDAWLAIVKQVIGFAVDIRACRSDARLPAPACAPGSAWSGTACRS